VSNVIDCASLEKEKILGVGIGIPGLLTEDNQTCFYGEILKFTGITCAEFSQYIPLRTALYNDASAAGFGEFWIREKPGSAFYISLSNNVGGTVIIDNRILTGARYHSGEVGHLTIHPNGERCYCGQKGCVDPYLAATVLSNLSGGNLGDFFKLLENHDKAALEIWNVYLDDLALTINSVQALFDCTVILGGYVVEYIDDYLPELKARAGKLNSFEKDADYIDICGYKMWSIAVGAGLNFISEFIDSV
jgi:predicted NBD/HSP70 family sugar kinase